MSRGKKKETPPPANDIPEMPPQEAPRRRPKQEDLPAIEGEGVAPKRIKAIDVAADSYVDIRDTRMEWTKKEIVAREKLRNLMIDHGLSSYRYGDHEVIVKPKDPGVKVKNVDGTESEDSEE